MLALVWKPAGVGDHPRFCMHRRGLYFLMAFGTRILSLNSMRDEFVLEDGNTGEKKSTKISSRFVLWFVFKFFFFF